MKMSSAIQSLASFSSGSFANVRLIDGGHSLKSRLASMGILPGSTIEVLGNSGHGPVIVKAMGCQIALGRTMANQIHVRCSSTHG